MWLEAWGYHVLTTFLFLIAAPLLRKEYGMLEREGVHGGAKSDCVKRLAGSPVCAANQRTVPE